MGKSKKTPEEIEQGKAKRKENLMDINVLNSSKTPEERKEVARKAGKASVEKRRANRMMMEMARKILEMPVGDAYKANKDVMRRFGIEESEMNYGIAMLATMALKGMNGDVNAAKFVRDSAGMDMLTVLKEEQLEYMKENGQNINVNLEGELSTNSRVKIYLPERDDDPE